MRFVRLDVDGQERVGVLTPEEPDAGSSAAEIVAAAYGTGSVRLLPAGTDLLAAAVARQKPAEDAPSIPMTEARLLSPVRPASFRDFVSFEQHVQGAAAMTGNADVALAAWSQQPTYLYGSPHSVVGPEEPVAAPPGSEALDFELEVGVVIGRDGRDLTPEEAREHIAGYVIVNDWSARDIQAHEMKGGLGPAKSKDFATTVGPWLVTPDELEPARRGDRLDLTMTAYINGEVFGQDTLAHMGWSFEQLVSYASRSAWVRTGDLIASGTCHGGSLAEAWGRAGRQEPRPLLPGDVITLTVDRLGTVANPVVAAAPERSPIPRPTPLAELQADTGVRP
ncbi:fumarylacetoacetate hydrolase family protein [Modestobacter altitudinis]|uniref:fumarylacetoacetate hydrolase family protein n=1 Tax=Modestobacter altitudinis TaxID=2213158 RepID=UPI001C551881|nr:fumarylacetoacetate hydrolase family protein [Modestobacter altitudinis]